MLRRMRNRKGFTLIELMVVVAIIGILAAIAIPMYRTQQTKARISEVVRACNTIASALGDYHNEEDNWTFGADLGATGIYNTLGVAVIRNEDDADAYCDDIAVATGTGNITATLINCGDSTDGETIRLAPTVTGSGAIYWTWSSPSGLANKYIPKD